MNLLLLERKLPNALAQVHSQDKYRRLVLTCPCVGSVNTVYCMETGALSILLEWLAVLEHMSPNTESVTEKSKEKEKETVQVGKHFLKKGPLLTFQTIDTRDKV